ncbi:2664_t:CDS:1, partial [Racocetra fulgida]
SLPNKSQIEKFLKAIIEKRLNEDDIIIPDIKDSYKGALVKWVLKEDGKLFQASKFDKNTKKWESVGGYWNIRPKHIKISSKFVYSCELLGNEDLAMITSVGLLIWSIWKKDKIRLQYYKGFPFQAPYLYEKDYNNRFILGTYKSIEFYKKMGFEVKKSHIKKLLYEIQECKDDNYLVRLYLSILCHCNTYISWLSQLIPLWKHENKQLTQLDSQECNKNQCKKNSLPSPDFDVITQFYDEFRTGEEGEIYPLKELLEDYLEDK